MSRDEQIFLDPGHRDAERAAKAIAQAVGGRYIEQTGTDRLVKAFGAAVSLDELEDGVFVTGAVYVNRVGAHAHLDPPEDREVHDGFPLIWNLMLGPHWDEGHARRGARIVFDRLVAAGVDWPMILTHDTSELVATYDVEHGVHEFPHGTSTYVAERPDEGKI